MTEKTRKDYEYHRKRLKQKFQKSALSSWQDYEILEFILTYAVARKDTKPAAKALIKKFKNFHSVLEAPLEEIKKIDGIGEHSAILINLIKQSSDYYLKEKAFAGRDVISSPENLMNYFYSSMKGLKDEHFRVIYLNAKNEIIDDETVQEGTVDQTAVYPRKIISRALDKNAVSLIFVHNHPSGNPSPSEQDKQLTASLVKAASVMGIRIHDHVIIGKSGYYSFNEMGII